MKSAQNEKDSATQNEMETGTKSENESDSITERKQDEKTLPLESLVAHREMQMKILTCEVKMVGQRKSQVSKGESWKKTQRSY